MKQFITIFLSLVVFTFILFTGGCKKDESFTHVTDFEYKIYLAVNSYRSTKSLPTMKFEFLMVDDAQLNSKKMASGLLPYSADSGDEVMINLNNLRIQLAGDAHAAVVQFSESENSDTIVNRMIRDPLKRQILEGNYNLTGVGSAKDPNGKWYVTQLFIHKL